MTQTVEIRDLDASGQDRLAGTIRWDGQRFTLVPNSALLRSIKDETLFAKAPDGSGQLTSEKFPEEWLRELQFHYKSAHLRASAPRDDDGPALKKKDKLSRLSEDPDSEDDGEDDDLQEKADLIAEIMTHFVDDDYEDELSARRLYSEDQPRDERGRFGTTGTNSRDKAREIANAHRGKKMTKETAKEFEGHLRGMTVAQLHELKREHGIKASGNKAELTKKISERVRGKLEKDKAEKAVKTKEKKPDAKPEAKSDPFHDAPIKIEYTPPKEPDRIDKSAPIHERLAAYKDGDAKVKALANIRDRQLYWYTKERETRDAQRKFWEDRKASGVKNPYKLGKKDEAKLTEMNEANLHAQRQTNQVIADRAEAVSRVFAAKDPIDLKPTIRDEGGHFNDSRKREIEDGHRFVASVTEKAGGVESLHPTTVAIRPVPNGDDRASYSDDTQSVKISSQKQYSQTSTVVHELGHHLEDRVPGAKEAAQEFLKYRVGDEKPVKMKDVEIVTTPGGSKESGFEDHEMGRKDEFDKAFIGPSAYYVGKQYRDGSTEIISMGLEKLHENAPEFAKRDPEFTKLILGVLDGKLRK